MGLTKKIEQKIHQKIAERKENKATEKYYKDEEKRSRQISDREARMQRLKGYQEGVKKREYEKGKSEALGTQHKQERSHKSVKGAVKYASRTPRIEPAGDMLTGFLGPSFFGPTKKPKVPTKTTTVKTGNKTIRITEKAEGEEQPKKKKDQDLSYLDPFKIY